MSKNIKIQENMVGKQVDLYCLSCENNTVHSITHSLLQTDMEILSEFSINQNFTNYITTYCIICNDVSFIEESYNSFILDHYGNPIVDRRMYPSRINLKKDELIKDTLRLPVKIRTLYSETLYALTQEENKNIMISVNLRTMADLIYNDLLAKSSKDKRKRIEEKIDELSIYEEISDYDIKTLHRIRKNGGSSTHQGKDFYIIDILSDFCMIVSILKKLYINIPNKKFYFDSIESQDDVL